MSLIRIPEGTAVHLAEGTAKGQVSTHAVPLGPLHPTVPTGFKVGGGTQVLLRDVDPSWVQWTGRTPWPTVPEVLPHAAAGAAGVESVQTAEQLQQSPR